MMKAVEDFLGRRKAHKLETARLNGFRWAMEVHGGRSKKNLVKLNKPSGSKKRKITVTG